MMKQYIVVVDMLRVSKLYKCLGLTCYLLLILRKLFWGCVCVCVCVIGFVNHHTQE
jgi:hypothetical protein